MKKVLSVLSVSVLSVVWLSFFAQAEDTNVGFFANSGGGAVLTQSSFMLAQESGVVRGSNDGAIFGPGSFGVFTTIGDSGYKVSHEAVSWPNGATHSISELGELGSLPIISTSVGVVGDAQANVNVFVKNK